MLADSFGSILSHSMNTVWTFFEKGGWPMAPILACSLLMAAIIVWKLLELRRRNVMPESLTDALEQGNVNAVAAAARDESSVLGRICAAALAGHHSDRESAARAAETLAREEVSRMERGVGWLDAVFTITPMIGLIGTTAGLVRIFANFGTVAQDAAQAQQIADGISEAMNCTIAGLGVAVPAFLAQLWFSRKVETQALRMSVLVNRLVDDAWRAPPLQQPRDAGQVFLPQGDARRQFTPPAPGTPVA